MTEHVCDKCGAEYDDWYDLDEHLDDCEHPLTETRGDYDYCKCCGENLGEWRSNEEFYDTIGAPYDDN